MEQTKSRDEWKGQREIKKWILSCHILPIFSTSIPVPVSGDVRFLFLWFDLCICARVAEKWVRNQRKRVEDSESLREKRLQWESGISGMTSSVSRGPHQRHTKERLTQWTQWKEGMKDGWGFTDEAEKGKHQISPSPFIFLSHSLSDSKVCKTTKGETPEPLILGSTMSYKVCATCVCLCVCVLAQVYVRVYLGFWIREIQQQPSYHTCPPTWESLNTPQLYGGIFRDQCFAWSVWSRCVSGHLMKTLMCWLADFQSMQLQPIFLNPILLLSNI